MALIFKSKLYREEIKHWLAIGTLFIWAVLSTGYAIKKESKTILIAIDEAGSRLVTDSNDRILKNELKNFVSEFIANYYTYNENTFSDQVGRASDLMSTDLWESEKDRLMLLKKKLVENPLSQRSEIISLDLVNSDKVEGTISVTIWSRMNEQKVKLKIGLKISKTKRTAANPWGYEIAEVKDESI